MFAMCAAIIMAAWLLVVAAEVLTRNSSSSSNEIIQIAACASSSCSGSSLPGLDGLHNASIQERHQQQVLGDGSVQRQQVSWWVRARQLIPGWQLSVWGGAGSRGRKQAYLELGSKDSGPDLGVLRQ